MDMHALCPGPVRRLTTATSANCYPLSLVVLRASAGWMWTFCRHPEIVEKYSGPNDRLRYRAAEAACHDASS